MEKIPMFCESPNCVCEEKCCWDCGEKCDERCENVRFAEKIYESDDALVEALDELAREDDNWLIAVAAERIRSVIRNENGRPGILTEAKKCDGVPTYFIHFEDEGHKQLWSLLGIEPNDYDKHSETGLTSDQVETWARRLREAWDKTDEPDAAYLVVYNEPESEKIWEGDPGKFSRNLLQES